MKATMYYLDGYDEQQRDEFDADLILARPEQVSDTAFVQTVTLYKEPGHIELENHTYFRPIKLVRHLREEGS